MVRKFCESYSERWKLQLDHALHFDSETAGSVAVLLIDYVDSNSIDQAVGVLAVALKLQLDHAPHFDSDTVGSVVVLADLLGPAVAVVLVQNLVPLHVLPVVYLFHLTEAWLLLLKAVQLSHFYLSFLYWHYCIRPPY